MRPVIPVALLFGDKTIQYEALVDSGADLSIFPADIGELIGLDVYNGQKASVAGITGNLQPYYLHKIKISIGGWEEEIVAGFSSNIPSIGYGVLGQKGFFDSFVVKFDYRKQEIELKEKI